MGQRYAVNKAFFDTWAWESPYVPELLFADGNMKAQHRNRGDYVVRLAMNDERFLSVL